mmetsp:Transcript_51978/g.166428  ORF Transcript_51978/g.166428 Transcript_51978/m.166428 type:complete len:240 (+) Transcript_51978:1116-1835(+)
MSSKSLYTLRKGKASVASPLPDANRFKMVMAMESTSHSWTSASKYCTNAALSTPIASRSRSTSWNLSDLASPQQRSKAKLRMTPFTDSCCSHLAKTLSETSGKAPLPCAAAPAPGGPTGPCGRARASCSELRNALHATPLRAASRARPSSVMQPRARARNARLRRPSAAPGCVRSSRASASEMAGPADEASEPDSSPAASEARSICGRRNELGLCQSTEISKSLATRLARPQQTLTMSS